MRKMRNKSRRTPIQRDRPAGKRRKISRECYQETKEAESIAAPRVGEKREGKMKRRTKEKESEADENWREER